MREREQSGFLDARCGVYFLSQRSLSRMCLFSEDTVIYFEEESAVVMQASLFSTSLSLSTTRREGLPNLLVSIDIGWGQKEGSGLRTLYAYNVCVCVLLRRGRVQKTSSSSVSFSLPSLLVASDGIGC